MNDSVHLKDWGSADARHLESNRAALKAILKLLLRFVALLAILWIIFEFVYVKFPYIRPGANLTIEAKDHALASDKIYPATARRRVAMFGMSTVLAGFKPDLFDSLTGPGVSSYNAGFAGDPHFMPHFELMLAHGNIPTDIMLTETWDPSPPRSYGLSFAPRLSDKAALNALFPFHGLPRAAAVFFIRARSRGGPRAYYKYAKNNVTEMLADRGYFFIESEQLFASGRLPEDYRLDADTPNEPFVRSADPTSPQFARLCELLNRYRIHAYFVPYFTRRGAFAPAPRPGPQWDSTLHACPRIQQIGPTYWLASPKYFADPVHANPEGADVYTRRLAEIMRPELQGPSDER